MPLQHANCDAMQATAPHWRSPRPLEEAMSAALGPADIAITAYANEGRWVVCCPDCAGALFASRTDHRFMCNECANVVVAGLWRPVIWPDDVDGIEKVLDLRPLKKNQNWEPHETVVDLADENEAHGLPRGLKARKR